MLFLNIINEIMNRLAILAVYFLFLKMIALDSYVELVAFGINVAKGLNCLIL